MKAYPGNGSCYTAAQTKRFAKQLGLKPVTTPVTSPQSNGVAESFVKTLKRDYAKLADRPDAQTVMPHNCPNGSMTTILTTRTARWVDVPPDLSST